MAEQRHRTVLEYQVDDRQIRGLDKTLHRTFDDAMIKSFEDTLERSVRHMEALAKAAERLDAASRRNASQPAPRATGSGGGRGGGAGGMNEVAQSMSQLSRSITQLQQASSRTRMPGAGTMAAASYTGSYLGSLAANVGGGGEGFIGQALGGIPLLGGFLGGAVNSIQRYYQEFAQQQIQIAQNVGTLGSSSLARGGSFTQFGLSRGAAFGQAAQYAQSAGLTGGDLTGDITDRALQLQHLGGISDPTAVIGAQGVGGGMDGRDGARVMMQAVSAGLLSGIREARLGQFLSVATQVLEQGRLEGAELSSDSINQMVQGFAAVGMGFMGERGQRAMQSAIPTMRGFSPGMDVASLVGLRAAGFGSEGGPDFHSALQRFQEEPETLMPAIVEQVRAMAPGNERAQTELMRQIMPRFLGFTPTITQARDLVGGDLSGFSDAVGTGAAQGFLGRRGAAVGASFGVPSTEAAHADVRAGVGGQVAGTAIMLRNIETGITQSVLPRVATGIESILTWLQETFGHFQGEGFGGALQFALGNLLGNIGQGIFSGLEGATGSSRTIEGLREHGGIAADIATDPARVFGQMFNDIGAILRGDLQGGRSTPPPSSTTTGGGTAATGEGPTASASDALRRISRDAAYAADALEAVGGRAEGALTMG